MQSNEKIVYDLFECAECIKQNWSDSVGRQYTIWLYRAVKKIVQMEEERKSIRLKSAKIQEACKKILECGDEEKPKTRALKHKRK